MCSATCKADALPSSSTSSATSVSTARFSKAAAMPRARRRTSSNSPTAAYAARWRTNSCRRLTPSWRATASSTSSSRPPAWRCRNRWCRRFTGRRSKAASPSTASWWWWTARRWPAVGSPTMWLRWRSSVRPTRRWFTTIRSRKFFKIRSPARIWSSSTSAISSTMLAWPRRMRRSPARSRAASRPSRSPTARSMRRYCSASASAPRPTSTTGARCTMRKPSTTTTISIPLSCRSARLPSRRRWPRALRRWRKNSMCSASKVLRRSPASRCDCWCRRSAAGSATNTTGRGAMPKRGGASSWLSGSRASTVPRWRARSPDDDWGRRMHLLTTSSTSLDDIVEAVDLGQPPGDIAVLSFADSDLAGLAAAWDAERDGLPSVRLAHLRELRHPMSVDVWIDRVGAHAKIVVVRLLGGLDWWKYGIERLSALAREHGSALAVLPGEDRDDPRLAAASTLPREELDVLLRYFREGGRENLRALLRRLAHYAGCDLAAPPPRPVPRCAGYWPGEGAVEVEWLLANEQKKPVVPILFYRAMLLASDTAPVDALCAALAARGLAPAPLVVPSLKDKEAAAFLRQAFAKLRPALIVTTTAFAAANSGEPTVLDEADVPVLQIISAATKRAAWRDSPRGLGAADLAMHV